MNTMDFSILNSSLIRLSSLIMLTLLALPALADKPATKSANHHQELVLTLSDQDRWLTPDDKAIATTNVNTGGQNSHKKRPVDVDCGMDVNPLATYDNSLGNRLQGECNLDYHY